MKAGILNIKQTSWNGTDQVGLYSVISEKYESFSQSVSQPATLVKAESFVFICVRNSEVSPKTTEASSDQRATGINYAQHSE